MPLTRNATRTPFQIAFPWIQLAFTGYFEVEQVRLKRHMSLLNCCWQLNS
jgi:hypothetical protein